MNDELEAIFHSLEAARENPKDERLKEIFESRLDDVSSRTGKPRDQVREVVRTLYVEWRKSKSPSTLPPKA